MPVYNFTIGSYPTPTSSRIKILTGQRFHRLLVIGFGGLDKYFKAMWHCLCDCGNGGTYTGTTLSNGLRFSCGCYRIDHANERNLKHGETPADNHSAEYRAYAGAKHRCNPQNKTRNRRRYADRGIEFRFDSFEDFLAEVGRRPSPKHSLDRINNDGHYEKGNVRWATRRKQANNRSDTIFITIDGDTRSLEEWAILFNKRGNTIRHRIKCGWCYQCAVIIPLRGHCLHRTVPHRF